MRAAIYTRISVDQTGQGLGVERQLEDCEKLAASLGWDVAQRYSDNDISAFSGRVRPQYEQMLKDVEAGKIDALIAWHSDRLHRSLTELERFIEIADKARVDIRTVHGGSMDLSTSAGRMMARILGSVARQESEHTSERRRRANDQKAAAGAWEAGRRPFGYTMTGEPQEPEATAVRTAVSDVLKGKSIRQVAREWNEQGLRTTSDREWKSTSVRRVLRNPRYAALRVHRGSVVGQGRWEAIVDEDAHRAVVALLDDPARQSGVSFERRWQGSGVYLCGVCDRRLVVHVDDRKRRAYKCPKNHVRRQGEALDELVDEVVLGRLSSADGQVVLEHDEVDHVALQVERDGLQARADQLASLFADEVIDASQLARGTSELRVKIDAIDGQLAALRSSSPLADLVLAGDGLVECWEGMSADLRGKVINALFEVRVQRSPKGLRRFDPEFVKVKWRVYRGL